MRVRHARSLRLVAVAAPLQLLVGVAAWWLWGGGGAVVAAALACYSPTALALSPPVCAFLDAVDVQSFRAQLKAGTAAPQRFVPAGPI